MDHVTIYTEANFPVWLLMVFLFGSLALLAAALFCFDKNDDRKIAHIRCDWIEAPSRRDRIVPRILLTSSIICAAVLSGMVVTNWSRDDARATTTENVAHAFGLTQISDSSTYGDSQGQRYADCYPVTHRVSKTTVSAQLFCQQGEKSVVVRAPEHH